MIGFLLFLILCYFIFKLAIVLLPLFIVIGICFFILYACATFCGTIIMRIADSIVRLSPLRSRYPRAYSHPFSYLMVSLWHLIMGIIYQVVFTIVRAVNDGKNSQRR